MAVSLWGNCNLELWQTMCIIHNWAQKMCLRHNWDWVGFPRNSRCCCASVSEFFARNDFFARNFASFSYQYETKFAWNCAFIQNNYLFFARNCGWIHNKSQFLHDFAHEYLDSMMWISFSKQQLPYLQYFIHEQQVVSGPS